ncbi:MAG: hypothetical protein ACP5GI_01270 [Sulfolobales archaeon]
MIKIDYKLFLIRVLAGIVTAWIYDLIRVNIALDVLHYALISTIIMLAGLIPVGYISRYRKHGFWRYSVTQVAVHYLATVILA